jgi:hypothetical protein|tara:strand:- start:389 stop:586 length:198 start_codon:yes stop_codon:yes gene_type:complete
MRTVIKLLNNSPTGFKASPQRVVQSKHKRLSHKSRRHPSLIGQHHDRKARLIEQSNRVDSERKQR